MKSSELPSTKKQNEVVVFVHVPKAAGSTLRQIMDHQYSEQAVYRCDMLQYPSAFNDFRNLTEDQTAKIRCLIGHLPYGIHEYLPGPVKYATILRNPIDRFLSKYAYLCNNQWVADQLGVEDKQIESLEAFIEMQLQRNAMNFQTRLISGYVDISSPMPPFDEPVTVDTLETAKKNLKNDFAVVGLQDRFNESLVLMKRAFGWGNVCYLKQNVTSRPVPRKNVSSQTRSLIERHNELDMQLFEFAQERFTEQIQAYGPRFERDWQDFEIKNKHYFGPTGFWQKTKDLKWKTRYVVNRFLGRQIPEP